MPRAPSQYLSVFLCDNGERVPPRPLKARARRNDQESEGEDDHDDDDEDGGGGGGDGGSASRRGIGPPLLPRIRRAVSRIDRSRNDNASGGVGDRGVGTNLRQALFGESIGCLRDGEGDAEGAGKKRPGAAVPITSTPSKRKKKKSKAEEDEEILHSKTKKISSFFPRIEK